MGKVMAEEKAKEGKAMDGSWHRLAGFLTARAWKPRLCNAHPLVPAAVDLLKDTSPLHPIIP